MSLILFPEKFSVNSREKSRRIVSLFFYALIIVFFILYFQDIQFDQLRDARVDGFYLCLGVLILIGLRFWFSWIWLTVLVQLGGKNVHYLKLNHVFAKSWLGRYIPGKVAWIAGKIYFASLYGVEKSKVALSSFVEGIVQICVSLLVGIGFLYFDIDVFFDPILKPVFLLLTFGFLIILLPPVFSKLAVFLCHLFNRDEHIIENYNYKLLAQVSLNYLLTGLLSGVSFFFIISAFYPLDTDYLLFVIGVTNLAGAIGVLAIFTPGGLGVREGVQLILLKSFLASETLLLVLVAGRISGVLADLLFFVMSKMLLSRHEKADRPQT